MRPTRVLAGAAALSAALLVVPASAATRPQVMRGVTTIVADRSGVADLVLNDDATLRLRPDGSTPDITMTGGGRIIGFDLGLRGGEDGLHGTRIFRGGKLVTYTGAAGTTYPRQSQCGTIAGESVDPVTVYGVYEPCPTTTAKYVVLHQGHYHLTVLADGARVTATIRLRGVPGRSTVRPTKTLASGERSLTALDTVGTYSRWETRLQLPVNAEVMMNLDATWPKGPLAADVGGCVYPPSQPDAQTDFLPHCPRGQRAGFFGLLLNPTMGDYPADDLFAIGSTWLDAGPHRLGLYAGSERGVTVRSVTVAWIEREG